MSSGGLAIAPRQMGIRILKENTLLLQRYELFKITEYRDGCIFKTVKLGNLYVPLGKPLPEYMGDYQVVATNDLPIQLTL